MKQMGHGRGYRYPHSEPAADQSYLPAELAGSAYYLPRDSGFERELRARVEAARKRRRGDADPPPSTERDA
jgi:putative ATPase